MDLRQTVCEEAGRIGVPFVLSIESAPEVSASGEYDENSFVQVSFGPAKNDGQCTYLDFWHDPKYRRLSNVQLHVDKESRGQGMGGRLVSLLENVAIRSGCEEIHLSVVTNPSFWSRQGYLPLEGNYWIKYLAA
jgi:GNAT superfamily N-acetyltransferase